MYAINVTESRNLVQVKLEGTMTVAEVDEYMGALRRTFTSGAVRAGYAIVIDVTSCTIQTQDMVRAMTDRMAAMPKARAIAVIATSALARMQIRRLFVQDYARVCSSAADATAWVLEGVEPLDPKRPLGFDEEAFKTVAAE